MDGNEPVQVNPPTEKAMVDVVIELESQDRALQAGLIMRALGHKLRTPLTGVSVAIELAAAVAPDDPAGAELLRLALESARQLQRVVIGLLEYVDADEAKAGPAHRAVTVRPDELVPALDVPDGVDVRARIMDDVRVDLRIARKGLRELVANARAAGARTLRLTIDVADGDHIVFALEDDGTGFPPAEAQRLFEPCYQVDQTGEGPGAGLGLAILAREVRAAGGTVGAASDPGRATTVWFRLPQPREDS